MAGSACDAWPASQAYASLGNPAGDIIGGKAMGVRKFVEESIDESVDFAIDYISAVGLIVARPLRGVSLLAEGAGPNINANTFFTASTFLSFIALRIGFEADVSSAGILESSRALLDTNSGFFLAFIGFTLYVMVVFHTISAAWPKSTSGDLFYSRNLIAISLVIVGFSAVNVVQFMFYLPEYAKFVILAPFFYIAAYHFMQSITGARRRPLLSFLSPFSI
jgi:hypothetical protein